MFQRLYQTAWNHKTYLLPFLCHMMNDILTSGFQNGLYGALPYIVQWFGKILFAVTADLTKRHSKLSPTFICKMFNTISKPFEA